MVVDELRRAGSARSLQVQSLDLMLEKARQYDTAAFVEKLKKRLAALRRVQKENFCDEDIDESPAMTVSRGGEVANKVGHAQARHLF